MTGETCEGCGCGVIPESRWRRMTPQARAIALDYGVRAKASAGHCKACHQRTKRADGPSPKRADIDAARIANRIEDLTWMADGGESLAGAAIRLGLTHRQLDRWLGEHDRDLRTRLRARDPRDHNITADGSGVTDISGSAAYKARAARRVKGRGVAS